MQLARKLQGTMEERGVTVRVPSPPSLPVPVLTLARDGQDSIDLYLDQTTPSTVARIFSVSEKSPTHCSSLTALFSFAVEYS